MTDQFDRTPEGEQVIAMLRRQAPPPPDSIAGARAVMSRLRSSPGLPKSAGRLHFLKVAGPVAALVAASVVIALMIMAPQPRPDIFDGEGMHGGNTRPALQPAAPMQFFSVRSRDGNRVTLDSGLAAGLRAGDVLTGAGETRIRVTALGIFFAHATVEAGSPAPGQRLACEATPMMIEAQRALSFGGDPGALLDFGAVLRNLPPQEARQRGLMGGKGLIVVEVIPAILRESADVTAQVTTAGKLGLQRDDLLLSLNGMNIGDLSDIVRALEASRRSGSVTLEVLRNNKQVQLVIH